VFERHLQIDNLLAGRQAFDWESALGRRVQIENRQSEIDNRRPWL